MITLHGIKNCDSVKKARRWLETNALDYQFNDVREDGIDAVRIADWLKHCDADQLVNRRSTSWKNLPPNQQDEIKYLLTQTDADKSCRKLAKLLAANPLLIKRPVVVVNDQTLLIGFNQHQYESSLDASTTE